MDMSNTTTISARFEHQPLVTPGLTGNARYRDAFVNLSTAVGLDPFVEDVADTVRAMTDDERVVEFVAGSLRDLLRAAADAVAVADNEARIAAELAAKLETPIGQAAFALGGEVSL